MDAWNEHFDICAWEKAFKENGLNMHDYSKREYALDEVLPWDTIDIGVTKQYFKNELKKAQNEQITPDCRQGCTGCGMMNVCKKEVRAK